jgi:hypothetical protein
LIQVEDLEHSESFEKVKERREQNAEKRSEQQKLQEREATDAVLNVQGWKQEYTVMSKEGLEGVNQARNREELVKKIEDNKVE